MIQDSLDLSTVDVINAPNPFSWSVTVDLVAIHHTENGVSAIPGADKWPDVTPIGWAGPIHYCVWLFRKNPATGRWLGSAFLEFYRGKSWTGAPLHRHYIEWLGGQGKGYGPLENFPNVASGEKVAFMLTAGSQRLKDTSTQPGPKSPRERSNLALVTFYPHGLLPVEFETEPPPPPPPPPDDTVLEYLRTIDRKLDILLNR